MRRSALWRKPSSEPAKRQRRERIKAPRAQSKGTTAVKRMLKKSLSDLISNLIRGRDTRLLERNRRYPHAQNIFKERTSLFDRLHSYRVTGEVIIT